MKTDKTSNSKWFSILLGSIVLFSFALRLWGINFGLPYEYHVDEVQYVRQAASMGENGLEPVMWNNPPLFKYILLAEYGAAYVIGRVLNIYSSPGMFGAVHTADPSLLYLLGRGTSAFFGALTVLLLGIAGKQIFNSRVGFLAAWFLATSFLHVRDSHFAVNDIFVTFLSTLVLYFSLKIYTQNHVKWYVLAGAALGLGFAAKYTAVFSAISIILAHFLSSDVNLRKFSELGLSRLVISFVAAVGAALLASPYFLITPTKVFNDIYTHLYLAGKLGFDGWQIDPSGGYVFYLKSMTWGLGYAILLLSLIGLIVAIVWRSKRAFIILSLPILLYIMMGRQQMYFARFMMPAIPPLLLWSANVLDEAVGKWASTSKRTISLALIALAVTIQPLVNSIRLDAILEKEDTRTLAKTWIESNIPDGSKIALDWPFHGPPLSSNEQTTPESMHLYDVVIVGGSGLDMKPVDWYRDNGFDYLISSSFIHDIPLTSKEKQALKDTFYSSLEEEYPLIQVIVPSSSQTAVPFIFDEIYAPAISLWDRGHPGPVLRIYKLSN